MIGAPIARNRAWVLPKYLSALYDLDYPKENIHLAFLINGKEKDGTACIIKQFKNEHIEEYSSIDIFYLKSDYEDNRMKNRDYDYFAKVRNGFVAMRRKDDEYIFSVDSDVILEPDTLTKLILHDKDIVSALVCNGEHGPRKFHNIMMEVKDNKNNYKHIDPTGELMKVDVTGACYLIHKDVLNKGVSYEFHRQGEDCGFCKNAQKEGFDIYCDTNIELKHIMEREE